MDTRVAKDLNTYKLVNKATGKVEASGLKRVHAMDEQNRLWARGVKCTVKAEATNDNREDLPSYHTHQGTCPEVDMTTEAELNAIAIRIKTASSLRDLCDAINDFRATSDQGADDENELRSRGVDMCGLPTFGGFAPTDTTNIWSWDEDSLAIFDDEGDMKIVNRKHPLSAVA